MSGSIFGLDFYINFFDFAQGTPTERIILKSQSNIANYKLELPDDQEKGIRLVDGPTPVEGRLQLFHKGAWRSVCSNSRK